MAHFSRTIEVPCAQDVAFREVAEFSAAEDWDPGVVSSTKTSDGPVGVGTTFDLVARFRGRELPFVYTVTEFVPDDRIVIRGVGKGAEAEDTITFAPAPGGGSRVTYAGEIRMTGLLRLAQPFLGGTFRALGDAAIDGLETWLTARCTARDREVGAQAPRHDGMGHAEP